MQLNVRLISAILILFSASPAFSESLSLMFEQKLDHPYSQSWYAKYLSDEFSNTHEIYIKGEGKIGSFFGVLYLDCDQPKYSRWEAQGGMLTGKDVPAQVIATVRDSFCQ